MVSAGASVSASGPIESTAGLILHMRALMSGLEAFGELYFTGISEISVYPSAGYAVLKDEDGGRLYFDAGPMGPHHLPGHGHADALSISLFAKGHWLLVDPGVYSYHDEKWRNHFRSTIVHNTVTVDNQDQCVFWGPFRVAYPYQSKIVESSDNHVTGEHDGYRRLSNPVIHRREVQKTGRGEWQITDMLEGIGSHNVTLTFQYAPGVKIEAIEGKVVLSSVAR